MGGSVKGGGVRVPMEGGPVQVERGEVGCCELLGVVSYWVKKMVPFDGGGWSSSSGSVDSSKALLSQHIKCQC